MSLRKLSRFTNYLVGSISDLKRKTISDVIGATILGEIGDIQRFSSGAKLVAYACIDASVSQPGEYTSTNNRISKRGSPYLRKALFRAAFVASNHEPVFKAYYQKKRNEGKHQTNN